MMVSFRWVATSRVSVANTPNLPSSSRANTLKAAPSTPVDFTAVHEPQATTSRPACEHAARALRAAALSRAARGSRASRARSSASPSGRRAGWRRTYADLAAQPRYADAIAFFLSDLYGGADFAQRDADLARVVPIMTRMLPGRVITTIARGDGAQCAFAGARPRRSFRGCREPTASLPSPSIAPPTGGLPERAARERQIGLIGKIGAGLDDYVGEPFIQSALAMMRQPGPHRGPVGAARFPGAGIPGVPEDAGRRRVPGDHRPARARAHGRHLRGRRRAVSGAVRYPLREAWTEPFGLHDATPAGLCPRFTRAPPRGPVPRCDQLTQLPTSSACRNTCRTACALPLRSSA